MPGAAGIGDTIVIQRADGKFYVDVVWDAGKREQVRSGVYDPDTAYSMARALLEQTGGTSVWYCHHANPKELGPYHLVPGPTTAS